MGDPVKPPPFDYVAPTTLDGVLDALRTPGARVLAGGQSLLQDLRWRRLAPSLLVDIGDVDELGGITVDDREVHLGARVRHVDLEDPRALPGPLGRLFARAAAHIAHPPVRSRGTFAGSLAWAHPAAEWGAVAVALDARVRLASAAGRRELPAAEFLRGPGVTACRPDELITGVVLPRLSDDTPVAFAEHRRTHASFALVAVVVAGDGVGLAGAGPTARRAPSAEAVLREDPTDHVRAALAVGTDTDPPDEPHAGAAYRRHTAGVLLRRALAEPL